MSRARISAIVLVLLAALPEVVLACPVCFESSDENRMAFLATTAFLSLLPLGMVGSAGLWLRKRSRELDALEGSDSTSGTGSRDGDLS